VSHSLNREEKTREASLVGNVASIQFLRFIAAALVVFDHSALALSHYAGSAISSRFLESARFGASGVHIFFVISGFIMVYTSFRRKNDVGFSTARFLTRRFVRIYPIYFVYCALYVLFYHQVFGVSYLSVPDLIGTLLLLPGYSQKIIGQGWTLAYEVYFYVCFAIAMIVGLKRGLFVLTAFFLGSVLLRFVVDVGSPAAFVFTSSLLLEFLFGAWIAYTVLSGTRMPGAVALAMVAVGLVGYAAGFAFGFSRLPSMLTWGVPSALLVGGVVFVESNGKLPSFIQRWSFLGDSSYSLYLLHVLLIDALIELFLRTNTGLIGLVSQHRPLGTLALCCILVCCCTLVSLMAYQMLERVIHRRLRDVFAIRPRAVVSKREAA
jgi:exopolysaccharide production protein ExoZ